MKKAILAWVVLAGLMPAFARTVTELDTGWTADGKPVTLPHTWNALDASDGKDVPPRFSTQWNYSAGSPSYARKPVVYRRALPDPKPGRRYFVTCGGASMTTQVRVNDREVGRHIGSFTAFAYELTDALKPSGNVLEFIVDNVFDANVQPINADYSVYGGLYRIPRLVETGAVCIDPARTPVVHADAKTGRVEIKWFQSSRSPDGSIRTIEQSNIRTIPDFELWSPENPKLYPVTVRAGDDELTLNVGFRTMEFREDGFYLNGEKRKLRGVCRHQDRAGRGWGRSAADEAEDVRWIKLMGADAVRTAHYPQSEAFLDLCDREGLIVWEELPNVNGITFTAKAEENERMMAREMVEQHRNHPCIFAWGIFNELYNKPMPEGTAEPRMAALSKFINELDPTRPTVGASCRNWLIDLHRTPNQIGFNLYPTWAGEGTDTMKMKIDAAFATNTTLKIAAVSEYGAGAGARQHASIRTRATAYDSVFHPQEYQAYHHWRCYRDIKDDPRIWGSFLWVMFDLGSDAKIEGEHVGMNDKGMVSWDRMIAKDAFYFYKANWNPEPMLHLVGDRLTDLTDRRTDVLAFSNDGDVELFVNDVSYGKRTPDGVKGVLWTDVPLATGDNKVEVVSDRFRETAHWRRRPLDFPKIGKARALTKGPKEHFLASYFGINSWSPDLRYVLALETEVNGRLSRENEPCTLGVIDTQDGNRFIPVTETRAWNFQEAAMAHWLPWGEDMIAFNDYRDGKFVAVVMNWRTKEERVVPHPIAAVSPDGRKAVSLNYARIRLTRPGYGYAGKGQDPLVGEAWPEDDGLWYVDLMTGEAKLIVPIAKIRDVAPPVGPNGLFYFCHTVISRDGERIFWLGRGIDWYDPVKEKAGPWSTTAFTCRTDGSDIRLCFDGKNWGGSHFSWRDGKSMVVTVYPKEYPGARGHVTFTVGDEAHPHRLAPIALDFDGHCTWSADGEWMSSDGYIDETGKRNWLLMRAEDEAVVPVGSFFVPEAYRGGDWRCDLHGRWRPDGRQLGFNSVHEGSRQIYVIDLGEDIEKKPPNRGDPVHDALEPYVKRGEIAGMVSVLSDPEGNVTADALGWADAENRRPMTMDTVFAIFSMSKTFLGAAMMCGIDDGKISLDDEAAKYLPEFADVKMKDGSKPKRPLTVRDLCCHVNGFRSGIPCVQRSVSLREVARDLASHPLETQPGEVFSYGTATIDAAAACLEVAVGRPFEDYLKERVLDPLGMRDTTFTPNAEQLSRLVKAYTTTGGPFRVAHDGCTPQLEFPRAKPICPCAGGGLFSTPADMIRFSQMLAHHGEWKGRTIISRKTFDEIFAKIQTPPDVVQPYTVGSWLYGDWFGHEGAMRTDQRANLKTGHSRVFFIQTANRAGKAFFSAKTDWNRACDVYQKMEVPFSENMVRTVENDRTKRKTGVVGEDK